ncbi:MAG: hypothetical protein MJ097_00900 [Dorea sp.]|nr:hypothetical protein [Dorea sp.]
MKKYFDFYKQEPVMVDREGLHRVVKAMLTEQNLPECQKSYLQLIEDLYMATMMVHAAYDRIKEMDILVSQEVLEESEQEAKMCECLLETWERHLLQNSYCSGESCF